jgi:hypothetical protein
VRSSTGRPPPRATAMDRVSVLVSKASSFKAILARSSIIEASPNP